MGIDTLENTISTRNYTKADTRLVVIGKTGVGKSSSCNTLIGKTAFKSWVGASSVTRECQQETADRAGRTIQVVDTPGLFDTGIKNAVERKINECVTLSCPGPHAVLLVIRIGRFTDEDRKTVDEVKKWFGHDMLKYLIIIFTGEDDLNADNLTIGDYIRDSPAALRGLVSQVNQRYLTVNNRASVTQKYRFVQSLITMVDSMVRGNGGSFYTTDMFRQAEERVREEERKKLKRKRDEIEDNIKTKYARVLSDQELQLKNLEGEINNLQALGTRKNVHHADKIAELNDELRRARQKRQEIENDRQRWENDLKMEFRKSEKERSSALSDLQDQLNTTIRGKEREMRQFAERMERERVEREGEIQRRAEERSRRLEEEHRRRMAALEEERREEERRQRRERQRQAEREEELRLQREREAAEHERRRRHRRREKCTVS